MESPYFLFPFSEIKELWFRHASRQHDKKVCLGTTTIIMQSDAPAKTTILISCNLSY